MGLKTIEKAPGSINKTSVSKRIIELIMEKGWSGLNELQLDSYEPITRGENVIITAPTGHGKTEAALLPIFDMMLRTRPEPVAVLYITPMRALINDIMKRIKWWSDRLGFNVARKHGDVPQSEKLARLKKKPHILISTPESLKIDLDWSSRFRENYKNIRWIIIDEIHEFVGSKRGAQLALLLERLRKQFGIDPQIIALSATIGSPSKILEYFSGSSRRGLRVVSAGSIKKFKIKIDSISDAGDKEKFWNTLSQKIIREIEPLTIIFVPSRYMAERLLEEIEKQGYNKIAVHHSSISGGLKESIETLMKKGELNAVISTRTLELGIDISNVKKVLIIGSPNSAVSLLQKIGRSGHSENSLSVGTIISLSTMDTLESIAVSVNAINGVIEEVNPIKCPLDVIAREVLGLILGGHEIDPSFISKLVIDSNVCEDFDREKASDLLSYLEEKKLIVKKKGKLSIGPMFFRIWQFDRNNRRWWSRDFAEFFTVISDSDSFQVRYSGKVIGELDSSFVYKYLRIGDTIRLSGQSWKVIEIDDNIGRIEVTQTEASVNEIPIWRGSSSVTSPQVVDTLVQIVNDKERLVKVTEKLTLAKLVERSLLDAVNELEFSKFKLSKERIYIVADEDKDRTIVISPLGQPVNETLSVLFLFYNTSRKTLNTSVKISPYGIVVYPSINIEEILLSFKNKKEFIDTISKAIMRSPYFYSVVREVQHSLGVIGRVDEGDKIVIDEAINQILQTQLDIDSTWIIIEQLKENKIKVEKRRKEEVPRFIIEDLERRPHIKAWVKDSSMAIVKTLQGWAFTEEEIAEIIMLPPKTVGAKLKEMRKPESSERVVRFMDVDIGEWRWALLKDVEEISELDEFRESFTPVDENQSFLLQIRPNEKSPYISIITSVKEVLENWEKIEKQIPTEEVYEMKVVPLVQGFMRNFSPRYYFVPRKIVPLLFMNGVSMLQKLEGLE